MVCRGSRPAGKPWEFLGTLFARAHSSASRPFIYLLRLELGIVRTLHSMADTKSTQHASTASFTSQEEVIEALKRKLIETTDQLLEARSQLANTQKVPEAKQTSKLFAQQRARIAVGSRGSLLGSMRSFSSRRRTTEDCADCSRTSNKQGRRNTRRWASFWRENKVDYSTYMEVEDLRRSYSLPRGDDSFVQRAWSFPCGRSLCRTDEDCVAQIQAVFRGNIARRRLHNLKISRDNTSMNAPDASRVADADRWDESECSQPGVHDHDDKALQREAIASQRRFLQQQERAASESEKSERLLG